MCMHTIVVYACAPSLSLHVSVGKTVHWTQNMKRHKVINLHVVDKEEHKSQTRCAVCFSAWESKHLIKASRHPGVRLPLFLASHDRIQIWIFVGPITQYRKEALRGRNILRHLHSELWLESWLPLVKYVLLYDSKNGWAPKKPQSMTHAAVFKSYSTLMSGSLLWTLIILPLKRRILFVAGWSRSIGRAQKDPFATGDELTQGSRNERNHDWAVARPSQHWRPVFHHPRCFRAGNLT